MSTSSFKEHKTLIDTTEQEVIVQYQERSVTYDYADLNEIALAWSISIHKSQGSEYPVVILPLYMQHYLMLSRNLLYTGLTRAKKLAIVIGAKRQSVLPYTLLISNSATRDSNNA